MNAHVQPLAAWTDFTPSGPWTDGTVVVRNLDGIGFQYSASLNALIVIPNESFSVKNANNNIITNLPAPTNGGDAANKTYVDGHAGGGGLADAPSDGTLYGRESAAWVNAVPLAGGIMTGLLTLSGVPSATNGAATKGYVDTAVGGIAVPPASTTIPGMDGTGAAGTATTYARGDHVHPSDTTKAPLASPTFTGTPAAPTPATADNSTTISTTAFVKAQGYLVTNATITLSGDITGSGTTAITTTLATVNTNVGTFQGITVNGKGLVTAAVNQNYAPLASPTFTGTPAAPTATAGTNTTQLATTAFVGTALTNASVPAPSGSTPGMDGVGSAGSATTYSRGDHIHPSDTTKANLASPTFTGTPAAPTATALTNTTQIATTAYSDAAVAVEKSRAQTAEGLLAPIASPSLTGTPLAPTATAGTNNTQIASTAFVAAAVTAVSGASPSNSVPLMDGTAAAGTSALYSRGDHIHPTDTSRAPLASPTFTGAPAAPTPTAGTSTTQLATTAFVGTALTNAAVPAPSGTTPGMDGTGAAGSATTYARGDHVHPSDTTKVNKAGDTMTGNLTVTADIYAYRSGAPTTGVIFFGSAGAHYLYFDGTSYQFPASPVNIANQNFTVGTGGTVANYYFGNTGTKYIQFDGTNFNAQGGNFLTSGSVIAGSGYATRAGLGGALGGNNFNINWTGTAQLWIDATNIGTISITSDYRIKKDVTEAPPALDEILRWRPITYTGKEWGIFPETDYVRHSFIAHELQAVSSDCVIGEKDGEQPQSLDLIPMIARLTKAMQELTVRVERLETA